MSASESRLEPQLVLPTDHIRVVVYDREEKKTVYDKVGPITKGSKDVFWYSYCKPDGRPLLVVAQDKEGWISPDGYTYELATPLKGPLSICVCTPDHKIENFEQEIMSTTCFVLLADKPEGDYVNFIDEGDTLFISVRRHGDTDLELEDESSE